MTPVSALVNDVKNDGPEIPKAATTASLGIQDKPPATVEVSACLYSAPCKAKNWRQKGSMLARYLDSAKMFVRQYELCEPHSERLLRTPDGRYRSDHVAKLLGHSSPKVTLDVYAHFLHRRDTSSVGRLARAIIAPSKAGPEWGTAWALQGRKRLRTMRPARKYFEFRGVFHAERWPSGRRHQIANLASWVTGTEGSNPSLSAK
jgi:hypothetical protein